MNLLQILGGVLIISGAGRVVLTQKPDGVVTAIIGVFIYKAADIN